MGCVCVGKSSGGPVINNGIVKRQIKVYNRTAGKLSCDHLPVENQGSRIRNFPHTPSFYQVSHMHTALSFLIIQRLGYIKHRTTICNQYIYIRFNMSIIHHHLLSCPKPRMSGILDLEEGTHIETRKSQGLSSNPTRPSRRES